MFVIERNLQRPTLESSGAVGPCDVAGRWRDGRTVRWCWRCSRARNGENRDEHKNLCDATRHAWNVTTPSSQLALSSGFRQPSPDAKRCWLHCDSDRGQLCRPAEHISGAVAVPIPVLESNQFAFARPIAAFGVTHFSDGQERFIQAHTGRGGLEESGSPND